MIIEKYAAPIYNFTDINIIPKDEIHFIINDQLFFEQILLEIRGMSIPYSANRKHKVKEKELSLKKQINLLEQLTQHLNSHKTFQEILDECKENLEEIRKEKLNGMMMRSKANWIENREKPSKYFCSLEKRNYVNKNVRIINDNLGTVYTDQKQILNTIADYYSNLYSSRDDFLTDVDLNTLIDWEVPKLTEGESKVLEGKLKYKEIENAIKTMKNGKF